MGLLSLGTPMKWSEAKQYADEVRLRGIRQFISAYERLKDRERDALLWGDEVRGKAFRSCLLVPCLTARVFGYCL